MAQHRLVIEELLGDYLDRKLEVHHIDCNGLNNNIENLKLVTGKEHKIIHLKDNVHKRWQR